MKNYIVQWNRDDYGHIIIKADSEQEARDKFDTGDYDDSQLVTRGGSIGVERVELSNNK